MESFASSTQHGVHYWYHANFALFQPCLIFIILITTLLQIEKYVCDNNICKKYAVQSSRKLELILEDSLQIEFYYFCICLIIKF